MRMNDEPHVTAIPIERSQSSPVNRVWVSVATGTVFMGDD
jgi:hypothetical protein